jgi:uncharacterized lipoprotein YmbA
MKILIVIIFMLSLAACASGKSVQPNYKTQQSQETVNNSVAANTDNQQQPLVKKAKQKNPFPKNYYPVPHTLY